MIDQPAPLSRATLEQRRELAIARLSQHFAQDHLSVEELESRFERAYRATSVSELDALVADLPALPDRGQPMTAVRAEPVQIPRHQSKAGSPSGPLVRVGGFVFMGGAEVRTRPQKREIAAERRLRAAERRALGGSAERE